MTLGADTQFHSFRNSDRPRLRAQKHSLVDHRAHDYARATHALVHFRPILKRLHSAKPPSKASSTLRNATGCCVRGALSDNQRPLLLTKSSETLIDYGRLVVTEVSRHNRKQFFFLLRNIVFFMYSLSNRPQCRLRTYNSVNFIIVSAVPISNQPRPCSSWLGLENHCSTLSLVDILCGRQTSR